MNLSRDGLIDLVGSAGPLCPNVAASPTNQFHALRNKMIDIAYEATPRDEDGEPTTAEPAKVNYELFYGARSEDRMRLYRSVVSAADGRGMPVAVEALYFKCGVCGLILPANRVPAAAPGMGSSQA